MGAKAQALALHITRTAHKYARDPHQRTPWSVASCEQGHSWARFFAKGGGKMDDCTVIVALVQEVEE
ncbi:protein phosphatase [Haematococcus lacustris]|uniref:Protein phosphatase n=2 Tax=Haematococcus lacustris TaxID=44745 RepID=A0A6A0A6B2_HAELA|nr:protein phosphatase [Haematococcus lacustris]